MKRYLDFIFIVLLLFVALPAVAQIRVLGRVTNSDNEPLIGATVVLRGSSRGIVTDIDGKYNIAVKSNRDTLSFSYIGYDSKDIVVNSQSAINVVLESQSLQIDEVVAIGYAHVTRKDLTGSVSSIKADEIMQSQSSDVMQAMQGRMAGVQINTTSGDPTSGYSITIRGASSVNAGTSPLYVIDGVQFDVNDDESYMGDDTNTSMNPLSFIDPSTIESVDVLKDATATAIYGARGANGVVLITTKSAKEGFSSINAGYSLGVVIQPKSALDVLDAQEYINFRYNVIGDDSYGNNGSESTAPGNANDSRFQCYDYEDLLMRTGLQNNFNVSYMVGKGGTKLSSSLAYTDERLIYDENKYSRFSGKIKVSHDFNKHITIGSDVTYSSIFREGIASGGDYKEYNGVATQIYTTRPVYLSDPDSSDDVANETDSKLINRIFADSKEIRTNRLYGSFFMDINFLKDFKLKVEGNLNTSNTSLLDYRTIDGGGQQDSGYGISSESNSSRYTFRSVLNYNKKIQQHKFVALVGVEASKYHLYGCETSAKDYITEKLGMYGLAAGQYQNLPVQVLQRNSLASAFGRFDYNYKSKYYLTATARVDGSSKFEGDNKYGVFPSLALSWRLSQEKFMSRFDFISNAKLRASVGQVGNDRIPDSQTVSNIDLTAYANTNGDFDQGVDYTVLANPDLKWETTTQYNVGVDLSFLRGRLSLSADVYRKDTKDMLFLSTMPSHTGFEYQWQNIGSIRNEGVEIQINTENIVKKDFTWSSSLSLSSDRSKVLDIGSQEYYTAVSSVYGFDDVSRLYVDKSMNQAWGYVCDRILQVSDFTWQNDSDPNIAHEDRNYQLKSGLTTQLSGSVQPGDLYFADITGDGKVTTDDKTFIGDATPDVYGGFGNTFKYKNFDLNIFCKFAVGQELFFANEYTLQSGTTSNKLTDFVENMWTIENPSTTYSRYGANGYNQLSTYYMHDASYFKIQTITLGYAMPKKLLSKVGIAQLRFSVSVNNLCTFTKYPGMDPDIASNGIYSGIDKSGYPNPTIVSFGVKVGL